MVRITLQLLLDEAEQVWQAVHAVRDELRQVERHNRAGAEDSDDGAAATGSPAGACLDANSGAVAGSSAEDGAAGSSAEDGACHRLLSPAPPAPPAPPPLPGSRPEVPALADAAVVLASRGLEASGAGRAAAERRQLVVLLRDDWLREGLRQAAGRPSGAGGDATRAQVTLRAELQDGTGLPGETLLRLACDSGLVVATGDRRGNVLDIGRRRRTLSPALRRALSLHDRCCQFPGCGATAYLEGHHLEHWARGGETRLENLTNMCFSHHQAVHEGGYRVERRANGTLAFYDPYGRQHPGAERADA